jgi:hypothetical protein
LEQLKHKALNEMRIKLFTSFHTLYVFQTQRFCRSFYSFKLGGRPIVGIEPGTKMTTNSANWTINEANTTMNIPIRT